MTQQTHPNHLRSTVIQLKARLLQSCQPAEMPALKPEPAFFVEQQFNLLMLRNAQPCVRSVNGASELEAALYQQQFGVHQHDTRLAIGLEQINMLKRIAMQTLTTKPAAVVLPIAIFGGYGVGSSDTAWRR